MELPVREGDLISGKYAVERVLGDGGMGVVFAARHLELGERVALKFLLPEAAKNPEACQRFVREARAAARIKGEHVARVLDVGTRDDGMPFIVMEYLEGADLGRVLEIRERLTVSETIHYVLQACEAVAQAHALGIVHRDLKPANLFLTANPDGSPLVKVLDFGISKSASVFARTLSPSITTVNTGMGTPQYMSPEQARDASKVDARSDVWALGAIVYELLAGKPAFDAVDVPALVMMIATEEPPTLESQRPDVPVALAAVVRRCLQKNRDARFVDIAELARAFEPFAPEEARPCVARIARILGHGASDAPPAVEIAPSVRGGRLGIHAVVFAASAAVLAFGAFAWSKRSSHVTSSAVEHAPAQGAPPSRAPLTSNAPAPAASAAAPVPVAAAPTFVARAEPPARTRAFAPAKATTERVPPFRGAAPAREQRSTAIAPTEPGMLTFESNVPAQVALDGRPLGATPKSVSVAPGSHTVVFIHPELGQKEHALTLAPGQDKMIRATFLPVATDQP
ncbi:MAG TPA: serine/threonine-protein kinase [Polyangiaceae bacterium]|nr:serine/threonine-protein kinase [Polyangiaceae bacterium]